MDETAIDCVYGEKQKVVCSSDGNSSGFQNSPASSGTGGHVTAVLASSASSKTTPPFFIVAGKHHMLSWTDVAPPQTHKELSTSFLERFTRPRWFPNDGVIICSEKGSMTMDIIPTFIKHMNAFIRKETPAEKHVLLTLDGHSSRNGLSWLKEAEKNKIIVVKAPANTSHFLQPCDQTINKRIAKGVRRSRDTLIKAGFLNNKCVQVKLISALSAMSDISPNDVRTSFTNIGIWPHDFRFVKGFRREEDAVWEFAKNGNTRKTDDEVCAEGLELFCDKSMSAAVRNQHVLRLLIEKETTAAIVGDISPGVSSSTACSCSHNGLSKGSQRNFILKHGRVPGEPTKHLTYGAARKELEERLERKEAAAAVKAKRTADRAEKKKENAERKRRRYEEKAAKLSKKVTVCQKRTGVSIEKSSVDPSQQVLHQ